MIYLLPNARLFLLVLILLGGSWLATAPTQAQTASPMQPAATVDNQVITIYDVQQRIELVLLQSGTPRNALNRNLIASRVLDELISEHLRMIRAEQSGLLPTDQDVDRAVADFEAQHGWPLGTSRARLEREGIDYQTLVQSYRAGLAWSNIGTEILSPLIDISETEIDREMTRLQETLARGDAQEIRLFVITLAGDPRDPQLQQDAERLLRSLDQGAEFTAMARQFSDDISRQYGGDLGWISPEAVQGNQLIAWLRSAANGSISPAYPTAEGLSIFKLQDRRQGSEANISRSEVSNRIGNMKLQNKARALERTMREQAIIKRFVDL